MTNYLDPLEYELTYPMDSKDHLQAFLHRAPSPGNALDIDNTHLPQDLSYYLPAEHSYDLEQFYQPHNYLSPLSMQPQVPPPQYDVPLSPRSVPPYQQFPPSNHQWAPLDPDFTFPGPSSDPRRSSIPHEQAAYYEQATDPHASLQSVQPSASTSVAPPGIPAEHWTMTGSLDPSNNMSYRSAEHPRMRTAQACEKCRVRKAKCSGEHPACARCVSRGLICHYAAERRMRGPNKPKNKPPPPSSSSGSPPSSGSSRRSSIVSLPDGKPEIALVPAVIRRHHTPPSPPSRPASSGGQKKKKVRPPPLNLGADSNYRQRPIQPMPQKPPAWTGHLGNEQMTVRPRADVPSDVGSASSRASFASDISMDDMAAAEYGDTFGCVPAFPTSSERDRAGSLDVPHSASPMSSRFIVPGPPQGHGRSWSSGFADISPIFLHHQAMQQRLSIPTYGHQGASPDPPLQMQYPLAFTDVQWTSNAPFGVQP
ncbi:hypothetical protein OE88DRAFT_1665018 [Heliocybe sulcata]|uniref:Zn(2)-C6 fungal-type domain-containing protein n=1 Tax=Heliocybe sulcata TaxID=5364 RepID=A0A5C3MRE3_9AGAM|nr:hypothetical protein OE88DRAFT_1665018 [Heliocybe sulcata]